MNDKDKIDVNKCRDGYKSVVLVRKKYLCSKEKYKGGQIMAYKASQIAKKIVAKTNTEEGDSITNLKLQKLLYYQQGFHLAYFGQPLFNEEIEAWMYGPVVPEVYEEYKKYGKGAIDVPEDTRDVIELNEEQESLFYDVYEAFNQFSATALVRMTHKETPWASTESSRGVKISQQKMTEFFKTKIEE